MPDSKAGETSVPTVSRVSGDTIVELVYEREKRQTGLVVAREGDWAIEREVVLAGERLVPYSAHNNLIAHRCVLLPSHPEGFGGKDALLRDIETFLHRYVDLSHIFERIASHYILLSWVHDAFAELPYLRLRGEYGTGKTRGLIAIGSLCYKPFFAAGASTVSPIFHTLDRFGGTLVLDEADFRFSDATADLVKLFNNGTMRGMPVLRTIQNRHKEFNPAAFNVFGPKIIAMRGSFQDEALESRFLTEETGSRLLRSDIPLHMPDTLEGEALALRNRLLDFRLRCRFAVGIEPRFARSDLDPRLNQIALPLLSLMDDPELRSQIHALLAEEQARIREGRRDAVEGRVLLAALEALREAAGKDVAVQEIAERARRDNSPEGVALSPRRVGGLLRTVFRIGTRKSHGIYLVSSVERPKLEAVAHRYGLIAQPPVGAAAPRAI